MPPTRGGPSPARALLYALGVVLMWGFSFPVSRAALREIPPLALATGRFALATAVLWPLSRRGPGIARADRHKIVAIGLLGVTLYFALENYGLIFTTASHASLIVATVPLGSAIWESFNRRRMPRALVVAGMCVAAAGVGIIVRPESSPAPSLLGDLLVLGAMACWVAYTFLARGLTERYPARKITTATMAVGAATLLPLAFVEAAFRPLRAPSPQAWAALAYLGLLCSAAAYQLWNIALPALGVSLTNNLLNLIPLISVLSGVLLLGEPWSASIGVGGALVLGGVFAVERFGVERGE